MTPLLEVRHLRVTYRATPILDVDRLAVEEGEVLAFIGPNGAGKSTLLRVLAALEKPTQGRLIYRGTPLNWKNTLAYRRRNAVVLQNPLLLDMSVFANVALGWALRGRRGPDVRTKVTAWLDRFRVLHLARQSALTLSGGEARRVALARAFVLDPDILFLDEPFSGLDVPTREDILSDLRRVLNETGTTTVLVTHDRDEALALADRVVVIMEGRIRQVGTPREVFVHPVDVDVATFVGVENLLPGEIIQRDGPRVRVRLSYDVGVWAVAPDRDTRHVWACIRPEHVHLSATPIEGRGENTSAAQVVDVVPLGSRVRVWMQVKDVVLIAMLGYAMWMNMQVRKGDPVWVSIHPEDVHLIVRPE